MEPAWLQERELEYLSSESSTTLVPKFLSAAHAKLIKCPGTAQLSMKTSFSQHSLYY